MPMFGSVPFAGGVVVAPGIGVGARVPVGAETQELQPFDRVVYVAAPSVESQPFPQPVAHCVAQGV